MGDLTNHFSRSEFACHCGCGFDTVDTQLAKELEAIRVDLGKPIKILSGARCAIHNKACGGAKDSQHVQAKAADFQVSGMTPSEVYGYLKLRYAGRYGLGVYDTWVHFDVRDYEARWDERS